MQVNYCCKAFNDLNLQELYEILALRQEVFSVEQNCPYLDADGLDQNAIHVMGRDEQGQLATYTRLLSMGVTYANYAAIGRVVTAPFARGKGLGRSLMLKSIEYLRQEWGDVMKIKISAQSHLQAYYNSVGFERIGEDYLEDGIPHVGMVLVD